MIKKIKITKENKIKVRKKLRKRC